MRPRRVSEVDTDIMHEYIPQEYIHDNPCYTLFEEETVLQSAGGGSDTCWTQGSCR